MLGSQGTLGARPLQPRFLVRKDEKQQEQLPRLFCGAAVLAGDTSETHS